MVRGSMSVDSFFDVNVLGTMRMLEAAARTTQPIRRFLFSSTDGVYRPSDPTYLPMDEEHPQEPGDHYGTAKVLGEHLVRNYGRQFGLPWTIVRLGSVVAPDEVLQLFRYQFASRMLHRAELGRDSHVWPLFVDVARPWEALDVAVADKDLNPGVVLAGPNGDPWAIHFTDVRDAVDGAVAALECHKAVGEVFNVVGPATVDFETGATSVARALGLSVERVRLPMRFYFEVDGRKATRILGFHPGWNFERMVEAAVRYHQGDTDGVIGVAAPVR
jgi:UDP-glucose 4-epimerase